MPAKSAPTPAVLAHLPLQLIFPDPAQARRVIDPDGVAELAASIVSVGLIHPVAVRQQLDGSYVLVAGERRWRAYQQLAQADAKFATIPAMVQARTDAEARRAGLVENVVRQDLNPIERAEALHALKGALHTNWAGVARMTGLGARRVQQLAVLTSLRREVRTALRDGALSEAQARALQHLGKSAGALLLLEYLLANPDTGAEVAMEMARLMKRNPGTTPYAALELRAADHPASQLPPLPTPLDQTETGRLVAALRGVLRKLDTLGDDPGAAAWEVLDLARAVGQKAEELHSVWLADTAVE